MIWVSHTKGDLDWLLWIKEKIVDVTDLNKYILMTHTTTNQ